MQIFKNRPLALAACIFAITAVLASIAEKRTVIYGIFITLALLLLLLILKILHKKKSRERALLALVLSFVLLSLCSSYLFFHVRYADVQKKNGEEVTAEGYVLERLGSAPYYTHLRVHLTSLDGERVGYDAILETTYTSALQAGDRFSVTGIQRAFTEEEAFDEESFRLAEGCMTVITCDTPKKCQFLAPTTNLRILANRLNLRLSYLLRSRIGGETGGVASALLLGNRTWLTKDAALHFRRAGVSHLLALSGLHVSILIGALEFILRKLYLPKLARAAIVPVFAIGYLALTGFSMSTCRAVLMICVLYVGVLLRAQYDSFTALCVTLSAILLVTPYAVLDLSMWMSFLAAGAIIIFSPALSDALELLRVKCRLPNAIYRVLVACLSALAVGFFANLALLYLNAAVFGEISLASVPVTLLLSIPVTALIICSAILLLFPFLPLLPTICSLLGTVILALTERASDMSGVLLPVTERIEHLILLLLTVLFVCFAVCRIRHRGRVVVGMSALCAVLVAVSLLITNLSPIYDKSARTIEAGKGEIRLYTAHGEAVLVNDAKGNSSEAYEIKTAALDARCTEIGDLVMYRYYNQATYFILRLSARMRVERLHLPIPQNAREEAIASRLVQEAGLHGIKVIFDAAYFAHDYP